MMVYTALMNGWGPYMQRLRAKKKQEGLCIWCTSPRTAPWSMCGECHARRLESSRRLRGNRPWVKGKPGRPPKVRTP